MLLRTFGRRRPPTAVTPHRSPLWYNVHSYLFVPMGESKRALNRLRFWRLMPKGEKYSPKQKDHTTTKFKKIKEVFNWYLIFDIFQYDHFQNWYLKPS
jgi:hypothetical protein